MAGIRQHILPQFLLKGFASRVKGEEVFTQVYQKGGKSFETNIINVSVARYFYGKEGELSVDGEITDFEGRYASVIEELRQKADHVEVFDSKIPDIIAHLCIRTKHLRDSFLESSEFLTNKMFDFLGNVNNLKSLILKNPQLMRAELEEMLKDYSIPPLYKEVLLQLAQNVTLEFLSEQKSGLEILFQDMGAEIKRSLPAAAKEGHIKALVKGMVPEPRAEGYRLLRWFVRKSKSLLILGDIGCLFETTGVKRFKSLNDKDDKIKNVFLPISSDRLLVGTSLSAAPDIDFKVINEAVAKCSRDFFVCSESSIDMESLHSLIGEDSEIISKEELEQIVKDIEEKA
jgi:hypothetical protein